MHADSLTLAALLDSLRAVVPDAVAVSRADSVYVLNAPAQAPLWLDLLRYSAPLILVLVGWDVTNAQQRKAQRRQLFDRTRYEAWLRAAAAIEAYQDYLSDWNDAVCNTVFFGRDYTRQGDRRGSQLEPALQSADLFFPGISEAFHAHRRTEFDILGSVPDLKNVDEIAKIEPRIEPLIDAVGATYEGWRKHVHQELFEDLIESGKVAKARKGRSS